MNLFIIGPSGTGKTPVAKYVADNLGFQLVKSSQYFREGFQKILKTMKLAELLSMRLLNTVLESLKRILCAISITSITTTT